MYACCYSTRIRVAGFVARGAVPALPTRAVWLALRDDRLIPDHPGWCNDCWLVRFLFPFQFQFGFQFGYPANYWTTVAGSTFPTGLLPGPITFPRMGYTFVQLTTGWTVTTTYGFTSPLLQFDVDLLALTAVPEPGPRFPTPFRCAVVINVVDWL